MQYNKPNELICQPNISFYSFSYRNFVQYMYLLLWRYLKYLEIFKSHEILHDLKMQWPRKLMPHLVFFFFFSLKYFQWVFRWFCLSNFLPHNVRGIKLKCWTQKFSYKPVIDFYFQYLFLWSKIGPYKFYEILIFLFSEKK